MAAVKALAGGTSGFVDSRPYPALAEADHHVAATTRHPRCYNAAQQTIHDDVHDPAAFGTPLAGCEAAARAGLTRSSTSDGSARRRPAGTPAQPPRGRETARVRGSRDCPARRESSSGTAASRRSWRDSSLSSPFGRKQHPPSCPAARHRRSARPVFHLQRRAPVRHRHRLTESPMSAAASRRLVISQLNSSVCACGHNPKCRHDH